MNPYATYSRDSAMRRFLAPRLRKAFLIRLLVMAGIAYGVFGHVITPMRISGHSMEPTYRDGGWNFCYRLRYRNDAPPRRHDVVSIRMHGRRRMYLKRIVAFAGETIEFRNGTLFVNDHPLPEPYVVYPCDWNLEPRTVDAGNVYVVGDNRNVPIEVHVFGQTPLTRITGGPLW